MALTKLTTVLNKISSLANTIIGQATSVKGAFDHDVNVVKDYINDTLVPEIESVYETKDSITDNRKLSADGDFTGTWNGYAMTETDSGLEATVSGHTTRLAQIATLETAGGTGTAIILTNVSLLDGAIKNFIVSANNGSASTTINGKPIYKPGTTTAPKLVEGRAVAIWRDASGDCFFIKASAEGNAVAANVLAGKTFSNDSDTGIAGTIITKLSETFMPTTTDQVINSGQYLGGNQIIKGDANLIASNIPNTISLFGIPGTAKVGLSGKSGIANSPADSKEFYSPGAGFSNTLPYISASTDAKPRIIIAYPTDTPRVEYASVYVEGSTYYALRLNNDYYCTKEWSANGITINDYGFEIPVYGPSIPISWFVIY